MPKQQLAKFRFNGGYASDLSITSESAYMRQGSVNALVTGAGLIVPFKGLTELANKDGSRQSFLTDDGYAGLGDHNTAGFGSVFRTLDLMFFIGGGELTINGEPVIDPTPAPAQVSASSQLQYLKRDSGTFLNGEDTGASAFRFDVGHARPSAPVLYAKTPVSAGQKPMNAVVAVAIWRADSMTGQPSLPSEATTITVTNGSVIVQFPAADDNGQDVWGIGGTLLGVQIGNIYEIPTIRGGEVLESTLAYTRTITTASVSAGDATITLDPGTPANQRFTSADIGRRISRGVDQDSWIISITDPFTAECNDQASGTSSGSATVTHAVDGYERAVEVSWSDDDLLATATLAPYHAFEPPDGRFAGFLLDTFFVEDLEGTIFYSIPNYLSFPRAKRRIFTEDKATAYIDTGRGYQWRIATQSISKLYYVPGDSPIQLGIKTKNIGCKHPPNACLGYDGRLLVWSGRPTIVDGDGSFNSTIHQPVLSEFDGWEDQTSTTPVVTGYDPIDQYELWCYNNKIMAMHAPTGRWCSPIYINDWTSDTAVIQSTVIINEKLYIAVKDNNAIALYAWNSGDGSDMVVSTYHRQLPGMTTVTQVDSVVRAGDSELELKYELVGDFDKIVEIGTAHIHSDDSGQIHQVAASFRPNFKGIGILSVTLTCIAADGRFAIDYVDCYGEWNQVYSNPGPM